MPTKAQFHCLDCQFRKTVDEKLVGKTAKCPKCQAQFEIVLVDSLSFSENKEEESGSPEKVKSEMSFLGATMKTAKNTLDKLSEPIQFDSSSSTAGVEEVVDLSTPQGVESTVGSLSPPTQTQKENKWVPIAGTTVPLPSTDENPSSAREFVSTCDLFIKFIRILGWIATACGFLYLIGAFSDSSEDLVSGEGIVVVAFWTIASGYLAIEFQVLFLRFMRECVVLLDKIRELRESDT